MEKLVTWRRLTGALLGGTGAVAIAYGLVAGQQVAVIGGALIWAALLVALLLAMFQRLVMLMRMVAGTRADLEQVSISQSRYPADLRKHLAEQATLQQKEGAKTRDELLRLRKETKRGLATIEGMAASAAEEQMSIASASSAQQLAMIAALTASTTSQRDAVRDFASQQESFGQDMASARAAIEAAAAILARYDESKDELRRLVLESASTALRAYRDMRAELDAWQETIGAAEGRLLEAQAGVGVAFERQFRELSDVLDGRDAAIAKGVEEARHAVDDGVDSIGRKLPDLERLLGEVVTGQAAMDQGFGGLAASLSGIEQIRTGIDALSEEYRAGKKALVALSRDEKMLRSISRKGLQWLKYETVREVEAVLQLRAILDVADPTPLLGGWSMDPESALALVRLILETKPGLIVELGSGTSTVWIAMALRELGSGKIVSYDHLDEYAAKTRKALADARLEQWAEVRTAPLSTQDVGGQMHDWYDIPDLGRDGQVDVLIVDGPPGATGPQARYPAIPRFRAVLHEGSIVVVDDASRDDEAKIVKRWKEEVSELRDGVSLGARTLVLKVVGDREATRVDERV